jgi:hypothetical protein
MSTTRFEKRLQVGLGEAIKRLVDLEIRLRIPATPHTRSSDLKERGMLHEALNTIPLDLGFDCDGDDIPDTMEVFAKSAETGCCGLVRLDNSRKRTPPTRRKAAPKKTPAKKAAPKKAATKKPTRKTTPRKTTRRTRTTKK